LKKVLITLLLSFLTIGSAFAEEVLDANLKAKKIPQNVAKNFMHLFKRKNLGLLYVGASSTAIAASLDDEIHGFFSKRNTEGIAENIGAELGKPYVVMPAVATVFLLGHKSEDQKFRSFSYALAQGYILDFALTMAMKEAISRERPDKSDQTAFPSGHSSTAFTVGAILQEYYGHKAGLICYSVAGFVALSRVKKDVHWLSDILGGATLGYIVGKTVARDSLADLRSHNVEITPAFAPNQKAFALTARITWR
jgi:membrane-associated phospholipid phosphatase